FMARSFSQSLLAAAVAAVVGGPVLAQDTPLQEAVTLLRLNKKDDAVAKLREILAADPSNADALAYYKSVSQDEWYLLMTTQGEVQKIAQSILERAKVDTKARLRDEAVIAGLVATATAKDSDFPTRQSAVNKLIAEHGEFAVPALLEKLGNADDEEGQIQAISALQQIRSAAVLPLLVALNSSNQLAVQNVAAALYHIGDSRALPAMAQLASDSRAGISEIARKFLAKKPANGAPVDLMLAQSLDYLKGNVTPGGYSEVVWSLKDDKLVATDVPANLYPSELAKAVAAEAVRIAPSSLPARTMLAQANLAQVNLIEASIAQGDEAAKALEPVAAELKIAALAGGVDSLRAALEASVRSGLAPVAIEATRALATVETVDTIGQSSLMAALDSSNKQVRYAAAEALVAASGGAAVPAADKVVQVLAQAVTEQAVRTIHVIAPTLDSEAAVASVGKLEGQAVDSSVDGLDGMRSLLNNPSVDVVVINEVLPDRLPEDVIGNIKKDPRMANTKIVVIAKDEEAAKARFGEGVGIVKAPLTGESLVAAVNTALEGQSNPVGARAEAFASKASTALLAMAGNKGVIGGALANLALQLNRSDAISVPAAKSIGLAGSAAELPALVAALGGTGSVELKKASAEAIGLIVGRAGSCSDDVAAALMSAMDGNTDVGVRTAIAVALGKASLDPAKKAELLKKLSRIAAPAAGSTEG
ncbi:MAG: HEAT repeat domain-containing protein, partial [Planctomycetes bacterium]|nr:HEAT repeat domain-containing protein [Planctomycetota bacterium]